jgi:glycogen debranching enzyme
VTNGLGGYASATLSNVPTRRYHGLLIAALPPPLGRSVMLDQISEQLSFPDGTTADLSGHERGEQLELSSAKYLREFRLEHGLPIWTFELGAYVLERRLVFAHLQNTVFLSYQLLQGEGRVRLQLRPALSFRPHEDPVSPLTADYVFSAAEERYEVVAPTGFPPLRLRLIGEERALPRRRPSLRRGRRRGRPRRSCVAPESSVCDLTAQPSVASRVLGAGPVRSHHGVAHTRRVAFTESRPSRL